MDKSTRQARLIPVSLLPLEMRSAFQLNKWCTIIDTDGNADIYFKYYCTPMFNIADEEANKPQDLCYKLLKSLGEPKQFTINLLDRASEDIFDGKYFPVDVLDPVWLSKRTNINSLKAHFPEELYKEITMDPNFKLVFLFNQDDIPVLFYEKTIVMKVDPAETIKSQERSQDRLEKSKKMREERHHRSHSDNQYGAKQPASSKVTGIYKGNLDMEKLGIGNNSNRDDTQLNSTREGYVRLQGQQPVSPTNLTTEILERKISAEKVTFVMDPSDKILLKMDLSLTPVVSETKTEGSIARKIVQETPKLGARVYFNGQMYDPTSQDNQQRLSGITIRGKMPNRISTMGRSAPLSAREDLRRYQEASETATQEQMTETVGEKIEGSGEETIFDHRTEKSSMPDIERSNRIELFRNRKRGYSNDSGSYKSDENDRQRGNKPLIIPGIASNSSLSQEPANNQRVKIHLESQEILSQVEIPENEEDSEDDANAKEREYSDKGDYYRGSIDWQLREKKESKRFTKRVQQEEEKEGQEDSDEEDDDYGGTEEEREIRRLLRQEEKIRKKYEFMFNDSTPVAEPSSANKKSNLKKSVVEKVEAIQLKSGINLEESDFDGSETHTHSKRGEKRRGNTILGNQYLEEGKFSVRTSEVNSVVEVEEEASIAEKTPPKKKKTIKVKRSESSEQVEKVKKTEKTEKKETIERKEKIDKSIEKSPKPKKIEIVEKTEKADESPKKSEEVKKAKSQSPKMVIQPESAPNTDRAKRPPSISAAPKSGLSKNASTGNLLSPVKAKVASPAQKQQVLKSASMKSIEAKTPIQKVETSKFSDLQIPVIKEKQLKKLTRKESTSVLSPQSPVKSAGPKKAVSGNITSRDVSPKKSPRLPVETQNPQTTKKTMPAKKENLTRAASITAKSGTTSPKKVVSRPASKETSKAKVEDKVVPAVKTSMKKVIKTEGTKGAKK